MTVSQIYSRINDLKPTYRTEVYDFINFLLLKQKNSSKQKKAKFGCAKGRFKMSAGFDDPIEDLKEYMS